MRLWVIGALVIAVGCGPSTRPGEVDGAVPDAATSPEECAAAALRFCEQACECGSCVTHHEVAGSTGSLSLTWESASSCAVSYTRDWCMGGPEAPEDLVACAAAVESLTCTGDAVTRPRACEPAPPDVLGAPCTDDADCPDSFCVLEHSIGSSASELLPGDSGRCANVCREIGDLSSRVCGAECDLAAAVYCPAGWACSSLAGLESTVCMCVRSNDPAMQREACDRADNDCNGVVDDVESADADCVELVGPDHGCVNGACVPCASRCDGECVDPRTSSAHCGGCGLACDATDACFEGGCRAYVPVAIDRRRIDSLDAHDGYVYFQERGEAGVFRCPASGCAGAPELVYDGSARSHVVSDGHLFVVSSVFGGFEITRCDPAGCDGTAVTVATVDALPEVVAALGDRVFFLVGYATSSGLYRCPLDGCAGDPPRISDAVGTVQLALAATSDGVFFTSDASSELLRCPLDGPCDTPAVVADAPHALRLLGVEAGQAYFRYETSASEGSVARCPVVGCSTPEIVYDEGFLVRLLSGGELVFSDASFGGDAIARCAPGACDDLAASFVVDADASLGLIAADAGHLYLSLSYRVDGEELGAIRAIPR